MRFKRDYEITLIDWKRADLEVTAMIDGNIDYHLYYWRLTSISRASYKRVMRILVEAIPKHDMYFGFVWHIDRNWPE